MFNESKLITQPKIVFNCKNTENILNYNAVIRDSKIFDQFYTSVPELFPINKNNTMVIVRYGWSFSLI